MQALRLRSSDTLVIEDFPPRGVIQTLALAFKGFDAAINTDVLYAPDRSEAAQRGDAPISRAASGWSPALAEARCPCDLCGDSGRLPCS